MMLEFLGNGDANYTAAHDAVLTAIETVLAAGPKTPDLGGSANTTDVGKAIAAAVSNARS
jgi:tartrate dehydrogenase/decarboxylase/D-malate dehydrogenase